MRGVRNRLMPPPSPAPVVGASTCRCSPRSLRRWERGRDRHARLGSIVESCQEPADEPVDGPRARAEPGEEPDEDEDRQRPQLLVHPVSAQHAHQDRHEEYETDLGEECEVAPGPFGPGRPAPWRSRASIAMGMRLGQTPRGAIRTWGSALALTLATPRAWVRGAA